MANPTFIDVDFAKFDRPPLLHLGFHALHAFHAAHGRYPSRQSDMVAEYLAIAERINAESYKLSLESGEKSILTTLAQHASSVLSPMCSLIGSIAAQEVMKACTGKFSPIVQFLYFDSLECLPSTPLPESEFKLEGGRYDSQIAVFGLSLQKRLMNQSLFVVGAGAIGCEHLKHIAMMGVCTGPKGELSITDMDAIERSNLNRQFLFRPSDIGKLKSVAATSAAQCMNPHLNVKAFDLRMGQSTETVFGEAFFTKIDGVLNALDNIEARKCFNLVAVAVEVPVLIN